MDGDDSYGNVYSLMAIEGPHADPELSQPPSPTTETANVAEELLATILARLAAYGPPTLPSGPTFDDLNRLVAAWRDDRDQENWNGDVVDAGVVGADDDAYINGGFGAVPASGDAMAALPESTVGEGDATEEEECAVCLEGYEAGDALRTMPCAQGAPKNEHCIFGWLAVSRLCPLCRFALPAEVDWGTEDDGDDTEDEDDDDDDVEPLMT
ncbi:unnamed protein product [Urochloa decumbens]|uniref:RING-type domain-containing protein n=1 Tax=Urochloa decumbens TaxID=240449 RepID=A0ABC8WM19_9POAL